MTLPPPRPTYVITPTTRTHCFDSSPSALCIVDASLLLKEKVVNEEQILICGTDTGHLLFYSLSNYACLKCFHPVVMFDLPEIDEQIEAGLQDVVGPKIIAILVRNRRLVVQTKNGIISVYDLMGEVAIEIPLIQTFLCHLTSFAPCRLYKQHLLTYLSVKDANKLEMIDLDESLAKVDDHSRSIQCKPSKEHGIVMDYLFINHSAEDDNILMAYEDGFLVLYRCDATSSGRDRCATQLAQLQTHPQMVTCIDYHPLPGVGVAGSVDKQLVLWKICSDGERGDDEVQLQAFKTVSLVNEGILCCSIRPDGRLLATGGKDGRIRLFTVKHGQPLAVLTFHENSVQALFFYEGTRLACASKDKSVSLWNVYSNK